MSCTLGSPFLCIQHIYGIESNPSDALWDAILAKLSAEAALPVDVVISRLKRAASSPQSLEICLSVQLPSMTTCGERLEAFYDTWLALPVPCMSQLLLLSKALSDELESRPISCWHSLKVSYGSQTIHVPTWVLKPWQHLRNMVSHCQAWQKARAKLTDYMQASASMQQLAERISQQVCLLPFDSTLPRLPHLRTSSLPGLIGSGWLSEDYINSGADLINSHPQWPAKLRVLNSYFIRHAELSFERHKTWIPGSWSALDHDVATGAIDELLIPVHSPSHWTQLYVNLKRRSYAYSDTLSSKTFKAPPEIIGLFHKWLNCILDDNITLSPLFRPFELGQQLDSNSCGVAVLSSMAHYALGGDFLPWSQADTEEHRLRWTLCFLEFARTEIVSAISPSFCFRSTNQHF